MTSSTPSDLCITGLGVTSNIGQGQEAFTAALLRGEHAFGTLMRPGRQSPAQLVGAEISSWNGLETLPPRLVRSSSLSTRAALLVLKEAWEDAGLDDVAPPRIGLFVGGSNFQQRELVRIQEELAGKSEFVRPSYGMLFMDSDVCAACTEVFPIRKLACTVGGASASGHVAVLRAIEAVRAQEVDACIAIGALMDLSHWECHALQSMGAMTSSKYAHEPAAAARPFDAETDGFVFGESCGALVIEGSASAARRGRRPYAQITGWSTVLDGRRGAEPSLAGEVQAISEALQMAQLAPGDVDYVNPHGSGSRIGDPTELTALRECGLSGAYLNTTKSVIGHGLAAAGTVELIATLVQMRQGALHPSRNLERPIASDFNWVRDRSVTHRIRNALNISIGFGGVNTAITLQHRYQ
jgi:malonyl-ACP decarboxylase